LELTGANLDKIKSEVKLHNEKYIVKPNREGGGHNFYNEDALRVLDNKSILNNSIIMERINPPMFKNIIVRNEEMQVANCVAEISVYGSIISTPDAILENRTFGNLVRVKECNTQEGGIGSGHASIGSLFLIKTKIDEENPITYDNCIK
jgi:glutathione synthase